MNNIQLRFQIKPQKKLKVYIAYSGDPYSCEAADAFRRFLSPYVGKVMSKEDLLPGQDWDLEITKMIREAHIVLILLTKSSAETESYFQKQIKATVSAQEELPEGEIKLMTILLEPDAPVPYSLRKYFYIGVWDESAGPKVDYAFQKVLVFRSRTNQWTRDLNRP